jgi:lysophospholipase L1-like esterase
MKNFLVQHYALASSVEDDIKNLAGWQPMYFLMDTLLYGRRPVAALRQPTYREPIPRKIPVNTTTVVVAGGSTAACTGVSYYQCWTRVLESKLNSDSCAKEEGHRFEVINLGRPAGRSTDSRSAIHEAVRTIGESGNLDYLLWYEGLNDVFFLVQEKRDFATYMKQDFGEHRMAHPWPIRLLAFLDQRFAIVHLLSRLVDSIPFRSVGQGGSPGVGESNCQSERVDLAVSANIYNLEAVRGLFERGAFVLSVPLPRVPDQRKSHILYDCLREYYRGISQWSDVNDIPFYDTARRLERELPQTVFLSDRVHLNELGNRYLAEEVFRFVSPDVCKGE